MRVTLREYLHSLNVLDTVVDVVIDGTDVEISICSPIKLTPAGEEKWGGLIDNKDIYVDTDTNVIMSDNDNDYDPDGNLSMVAKFVIYITGFCLTSKYNKWFEGNDAELV